MEGVNSTKTNYKHFCKCHNVPPLQQSYENNKKAYSKVDTNKCFLKFKNKQE
jgi:hypothetical protein